MEWQDYIERNPNVMLGKPVIRGTRITMELILERLGNGWSEAALLESYPHLRFEHVQAAQAYGAATMASGELIRIRSL